VTARRTYRILFIGPPGAGKGTYAKHLEGRLGVPHISTGTMLRRCVAKDAPGAEKVRYHLDRGELIPDNMMIEIIKRRLSEEDTKNGFMLDGFPRTLVQAKMLDGLLDSMGLGLDYIFNIWTPYNKIVQRALNRAHCEACGRIYNLKNEDISPELLCDTCGGKLVRRGDDRAETLWHRLEVYDEKTRPIVEFYSERPQFHEIYTGGPVEDGLGKMIDIIEAAEREHDCA